MKKTDGEQQKLGEIVPTVIKQARDRAALQLMSIEQLEELARTLKIPIPKRDKYTESERRDFLIPLLSEKSDAQVVAEKIQAAVGAEPIQQWLPCAPMPTELCRTSPFFPLSKQEIKGDRENLKDMVITAGPWGELRYSGEKLSVYEEDILMSVLALADSAEHRQIIEMEGRKHLMFAGTKGEILKTAGLKSDGKANYNFLDKAIDFLNSARFKLITKDKTEREVGIFSLTEKNPRSCTLVLNEYFYEIYVKGNYTLIDVKQRAALKSPIAKALLRFLQSHREEEWKGHYITLAQAINLNMALPARKIRSRIKEGMKDLKDNKILTDKSCLLDNDIVLLYRHPSMTIRRKALETK